MKKIMVIGSMVAAMAFMSCANPMITDSVVVEETVVEETVVEEVQVVDTITLTPSAVSVNLGDTITLTPVVTYKMVSRDLTAESEITWTSSNSDMTVVNGVVTAIYGGETTITATQDGVSATTDLTFVDPDHDIRLVGEWSFSFWGVQYIYIFQNDGTGLSIGAESENALTWESTSDKIIITVTVDQTHEYTFEINGDLNLDGDIYTKI